MGFHGFPYHSHEIWDIVLMTDKRSERLKGFWWVLNAWLSKRIDAKLPYNTLSAP